MTARQEQDKRDADAKREEERQRAEDREREDEQKREAERVRLADKEREEAERVRLAAQERDADLVLQRTSMFGTSPVTDSNARAIGPQPLSPNVHAFPPVFSSGADGSHTAAPNPPPEPKELSAEGSSFSTPPPPNQLALTQPTIPASQHTDSSADNGSCAPSPTSMFH